MKIVIVGGFGVGKTTMVGSVSEIRPLTTEETMTQAGIGVDDNYGSETKTATTVAMDFGRISITDELVLYLFGTPGQERFWFLWNGLFEGALGAVVLVDTRRLEVSFDVIGRLEERGVPFVVAVNDFPDAPRYPVEELRAALDLAEEIPMVDVRRAPPGLQPGRPDDPDALPALPGDRRGRRLSPVTGSRRFPEPHAARVPGPAAAVVPHGVARPRYIHQLPRHRIHFSSERPS